MSFWNSRQVDKTRKKHVCIFCQSTIPIGSSCRHETGTWEGEFNDYYLCNRCVKFIDKCDIDLSDGFSEGDFLEHARYTAIGGSCPACGSHNWCDDDWNDNYYKAEIICDDCGEEWTADFSMGYDESDLRDIFTDDRLAEICEAERDGRLIICDKIKTAEEIKFEKYCSHAKRYEDGKCEGLDSSAENDEPCEMCKNCEKHYLFDEALEGLE